MTSTERSAAAPTGNTMMRRARNRKKASPVVKAGMLMFALGLLAVTADLVLFASGSSNLPLWINLGALLAPLGLGVGLVGLVMEARRGSRPTSDSTTA